MKAGQVIVAAVALTLRRRKDSRYQDPAEQVKVKKADRLKVIKVQPSIDTPAPAAAENNTQGGA